ncbi:MAG: hypothetical protein IJ211_03210 [Campylobacter sp.]|nr:hypothetical protein [Campylobacter sp.]
MTHRSEFICLSLREFEKLEAIQQTAKPFYKFTKFILKSNEFINSLDCFVR